MSPPRKVSPPRCSSVSRTSFLARLPRCTRCGCESAWVWRWAPLPRTRPRGVRAYRLALHEDKPTARRTLSAFRRLRRERPKLALVNAHDASLLGRLPSFHAVFD
jgi:hypothetical protein